MKISANDVKSLNFACIVLGSLAEQTIDEKKRIEIIKHRDRVRKSYLVLLNTSSQGLFDASEAVHHGIPDNSSLAKGIRTVCPTIED